MDPKTKDYIADQLRITVFAGRTPRSEFTDWIIPEMLEGEGVDDDDSIAWAAGLLNTLWTERLNEARTWPRPTDVERLQQVYEALDGFIGYGIEGSAYTQSDVHDDVAEIYHGAGGAASGYVAYLACHEQDIAGALTEDGGLYLMHGAITDEGFNGDVPTAQRAVAALTEAGFDVDWDGTAGKRIHLKGFRWHKDLPTD